MFDMQSPDEKTENTEAHNQNLTWPKTAEMSEVFPLPTLPQIPTSLPWTEHTKTGWS